MTNSEFTAKVNDLQDELLKAIKALVNVTEEDAKTAAPSTCEKALNAAKASSILIDNIEKLMKEPVIHYEQEKYKS